MNEWTQSDLWSLSLRSTSASCARVLIAALVNTTFAKERKTAGIMKPPGALGCQGVVMSHIFNSLAIMICSKICQKYVWSMTRPVCSVVHWFFKEWHREQYPQTTVTVWDVTMLQFSNLKKKFVGHNLFVLGCTCPTNCEVQRWSNVCGEYGLINTIECRRRRSSTAVPLRRTHGKIDRRREEMRREEEEEGRRGRRRTGRTVVDQRVWWWDIQGIR